MSTCTMGRESLLAALNLVSHSVEKRAVIPILRSVVLEPHGQNVRVRGTDMDLHMTATVPRLEAHATAPLGVPFAPFLAFVKACAPGSSVVVGYRDPRVIIECDGATAALDYDDISDFPSLPSAILDPETFNIPGADLASALKLAVSCVSHEETRYYLNGVNMAREADGALVFVATDGHRLAYRRVSASASAAPGTCLPESVIVATYAVTALIALAERAERVSVRISKGVIEAQGGSASLTSKLVDGAFPDWRRLAPGAGHTATFDRVPALKAVDQLGKAVSRAASDGQAMRGPASPSVVLSLSPSGLRVMCADSSSAALPATCATVWEVRLNVRYVTSVLRQLAGERVRVESNAPNADRPDTLKLTSSDGGDATFFLLAPMRM